jgi:hypothetical protein
MGLTRALSNRDHGENVCKIEADPFDVDWSSPRLKPHGSAAAPCIRSRWTSSLNIAVDSDIKARQRLVFGQLATNRRS